MSDSKDYAPLDIDDYDDEEKRITKIRDEFGEEELLDNPVEELLFPAIALLLYAIPAFLPLIDGWWKITIPNKWIAITGLPLIFIGIGIYILTYCDEDISLCKIDDTFIPKAGKAGNQDVPSEVYDKDFGVARTSSLVDDEFRQWPWTFPTRKDLMHLTIANDEANEGQFREISDKELRILLTEYEQVSEEGRYRDRLFNRSMYFGLAIVALFAAAARDWTLSRLPGALMIVSLVTFVFAMAIFKYKDARDPLWKRQRDLERLVPAFRGRLTTFHTIRTPKRRSYDRLSFTSFLVNLYTMLFLLSTSGYIATIVLYGIVGPI